MALQGLGRAVTLLILTVFGLYTGIVDGAFVKLFVRSIPQTITKDEVRPMFAKHGNVLEVAIIEDIRTGNQPQEHYSVRPSKVATIGDVEHKLFVGSLNKQAFDKEIEELFLPYGRVDDVYIMRDE